jgi:hypothetical protein
VKCHERGRKQLIRSFNDLHRIVWRSGLCLRHFYLLLKRFYY